MDSLLNNPAIQSGVLPLLIALIGCLLIGRTGRHGTALPMLLAIALSMVLVIGLQFMPLTSTRKLLVVALAAIVAAALIDIRVIPWKTLLPVTLAAGLGAAIWLVWPVLTRREGADLILLLATSGVYAAWICAATDGHHRRAVPALSATLALALGTGVSALLGASALLGQLGLSLAAAVGGGALVHLIRADLVAGRVWVLPVSLVSALIGVAGHVYAKLPIEALLLLALVPLVAYIPLPSSFPVRLRLIICGLLCLIPAGAAIMLTWRFAGGVPL